MDLHSKKKNTLPLHIRATCSYFLTTLCSCLFSDNRSEASGASLFRRRRAAGRRQSEVASSRSPSIQASDIHSSISGGRGKRGGKGERAELGENPIVAVIAEMLETKLSEGGWGDCGGGQSTGRGKPILNDSISLKLAEIISSNSFPPSNPPLHPPPHHAQNPSFHLSNPQSAKHLSLQQTGAIARIGQIVRLISGSADCDFTFSDDGDVTRGAKCHDNREVQTEHADEYRDHELTKTFSNNDVISGWREVLGFPAPVDELLGASAAASAGASASDGIVQSTTSSALEEVLRKAVETKCWPLTLKKALVEDDQFRDAQHVTFFSTQFGESKFLIGKIYREIQT